MNDYENYKNQRDIKSRVDSTFWAFDDFVFWLFTPFRHSDGTALMDPRADMSAAAKAHDRFTRRVERL